MLLIVVTIAYLNFHGGSDGKVTAYNMGDLGSIPGLGRSPGEGNGNPLQYSCWRVPWTEEPGGLQSIRLQRLPKQIIKRNITYTNTHTVIHPLIVTRILCYFIFKNLIFMFSI